MKITKVTNNAKIISSLYLQKLSDDVYKLIINSYRKWDTKVRVGYMCENNETIIVRSDAAEEAGQYVPAIIELDFEGNYWTYCEQEKDQTYVIFLSDKLVFAKDENPSIWEDSE